MWRFLLVVAMGLTATACGSVPRPVQATDFTGYPRPVMLNRAGRGRELVLQDQAYTTVRSGVNLHYTWQVTTMTGTTVPFAKQLELRTEAQDIARELAVADQGGRLDRALVLKLGHTALHTRAVAACGARVRVRSSAPRVILR